MPVHSSKAASAFFLSMLLAANSPVAAQNFGFFPPVGRPPIGFPTPINFPFPGHGRDTATPIKHIVIIFGENESFDHYFGTYPKATNPSGEPVFHASPFTPPANNYVTNPLLATNNPNFQNQANNITTNGVVVSEAANPFRLDHAQAHTADQNHAYTPEQEAYDDGKMDLFPEFTGTAGTGGTGAFNTQALVMGYYDGNTVTALWNYAQNFAMDDNSYSSQFGPSSPGAVNLISGQTNGAVGHAASNGSNPTKTINNLVDDGQGGFTMFGDSDPFGDTCSSTTAATTSLTGKNIGDLLNAKNISWGWFEGGFDLTITNSGPNGNNMNGCNRATSSATLGVTNFQKDYVPHHQPFQYYKSTQNLAHTRPTSAKVVGTSNDGGANHQYDTHDFFDALKVGNLAAVSFLKAPAFEDAHPGNSDPIDEQTFVTTVINTLEQSPFWNSTAVIIAYDDSDGWYDHANHVFNPSVSADDALLATGQCGPLNSGLPATTAGSSNTVPVHALNGINGKPVDGRCGYGTRQPLIVISPWAKHNFIDHTVTDQSSIIRFIEDNWLRGERIGQGNYDAVAGSLFNMFNFAFGPSNPRLFLNTNTGEPTPF
ncbi:MAG: alkaline phosphatase family protein [Pseudomonadota bacterium]